MNLLHIFTVQKKPLLIAAMILTLGLTTVSCSIPVGEAPNAGQTQTQAPAETIQPTQMADGQYPVQQVTYDDATGEYSAVLLNTSPGQPSVFRAQNLPMARLTDEEISNGQTSYLKVEQGQPALYLTEDFRIEYVHNVAETVTNPQTGQSETVIVDRRTSFWTPFAGALAGQAVGSLLFRPQYYMPPIYQPGVVLVGYGGYGRTYGQAVQRYQTRYQAPPHEVRNRQVLRTSGRLRSPSTSTGTSRIRQTPGNRSSGTGYGNSNLRRRNTPSYNRPARRPGSFGRRGFRRR